MTDQDLVSEFVACGHIVHEQVLLWREVAGLMAVFDAIGRQDGVNAMLKIDGGRVDGAVYTVVVSGTFFGERFFRQDGSDLAGVLRGAIAFYKKAS